MNIPDAAIEAAAEAIAANLGCPWPTEVETLDERCREDARASIEAALPAIREALAQEIEAHPAYIVNLGLREAALLVRGGAP